MTEVPSSTNLMAEVDSLDKKLQLLATTPAKPWYKEASTIIAILALLFSFGTTVVSYVHTSNQETQALKSELRGLLQRLVAISKESTTLNQRYQNDPTTFYTYFNAVNQENILVTEQASEIMRQLPNSKLSAADFIGVAGAMVLSSRFDAALLEANKALLLADSPDDEMAALTMIGALDLSLGKVGDGRNAFQQALDMFGGKYSKVDETTKKSTGVLTELAWASSEAAARNVDMIEPHLRSAERIAASLGQSQNAEMLKLQITQTRRGLLNPNSNAPSELPTTPLVSGTPPIAFPKGAGAISGIPPTQKPQK